MGTIGDWAGLTSVTCTTRNARMWLHESPPGDLFWLVVPQNAGNQGSYGLATSGERSPAASACKPQAVGSCF